MNIAIIPARGGSKRIPKKNIKLFNGKPIISYAIETALSANIFDKVIVSTDDEEISKVAMEYGAEVPFIRPKELSDDFSVTHPVISHAVKWFFEKDYNIKNVCCIYATAPLINVNDLNKALDIMESGSW